ncbi:hypothetical protein [Hymenobacter baengnokdamensis]|uniref:hypothetical protein n=1 Tax=Hymenobacter baengnokdamensis TaxID=2615203 RepID=UPI001246BC5E|nr:hypothetical protein [Hymenobacter baengnokdamensis]
MNFRRKPKTRRPEQIADLVLKHLHERGVSSELFFLNDFLSKKNIYKDVALLKAVFQLLLDEELIKENKDSRRLSAFGYDLPNQVATSPENTFPEIKLILYPIDISVKGRYFVSHGQSLDKQGVAEALENAKKWRERRLNFLIALITAIAVVCVTEPIKRYFAPDKANIQNASSPLRPRLNPR